MPNIIHVAQTGQDHAQGTEASPFRTINHAARKALPGDTVRVHEGVYREWVRPTRGGSSDQRRITFEAAENERVVITGSEQVRDWELVDGTVWRASVPNTIFGDFNPFAEELDGDWIDYRDAGGAKRHLGDVYLNGVSFYEANSLPDVHHPARRTMATDAWTGSADPIRNPEQTLLVWFAEVEATHTTIYANFQTADPNAELVEVNVRRSVFFPDEHHVDFVTVRGFELCQAATPWSPPTANQPGLIGPNWAKGWIIEDNSIHDAKCSAISLGKEGSTGHNEATARGDKPGYLYQIESVFAASQIGWDREHIGSHIVRRNTIFDCGQNGIVGHLGAVFSTIADNHIYNIAVKREFYGYEIAGIKLHAAIDTQIIHNRINDCTLGVWLDWQTQGTRMSRNVLHDNCRDLFIEVSHGPYIVDHNVLGSRASLEVFSQGGAFINNLVCGTVTIDAVIDRPTPYHRPHSTQIAGYAPIYGGDDRYVGNIFLDGDAAVAYGPTMDPPQVVGYGTSAYDGHPATIEAFMERVSDPTLIDHDRFTGALQSVYIERNVYAPGAKSYAQERAALHLETAPQVEIVAGDGDGDGDGDGAAVYLIANLPSDFEQLSLEVVTSADLTPVRVAGAHFENPDGTPVSANVDVTGAAKVSGRSYPAGPVANLRPGSTRTRIW